MVDPSWYLWLKALHIIAMVCWFAGLFYLPRLFVYHVLSDDAPSQARFALMQRKLYRGIMWPSMVATWVLGLLILSINPSIYMQQGWMHAKLTLVVLLSAYHLWCGLIRTRLLTNPHYRSHVYFRWFNEVPVFFLVAIVVLVVVKPF